MQQNSVNVYIMPIQYILFDLADKLQMMCMEGGFHFCMCIDNACLYLNVHGTQDIFEYGFNSPTHIDKEPEDTKTCPDTRASSDKYKHKTVFCPVNDRWRNKLL